MEPKNIRFGGGAPETLLHPFVAVWMLVAIVLMLTLPRKKAIAPFLLAVFTIPIGQVLLVGGMHFTVMRILIVVGLLRAIRGKLKESGGRWFPTGFNPIDQVAVLWTISALIVVTLQWMNSQMLVASLGNFLDALGGYLVVRYFIVDGEGIRRTIRVFAVICAILGITMTAEQVTGVNVFNILGGVDIPVETTIRDGQLRSSGVMGPLGVGVLAAVLMPLFIWLWQEKKSRKWAYMGLAGALAMLITTHASTPWLGFAGALLGLCFWPMRRNMRIFRWSLVFVLIGLHMVMKAPVWHLISRIDLTGSSSSYHRYTLVNQTIIHFSDWWLLGYRYYDKWDWDMWDTSNQFVAAALTGGLSTLLLVVAVFSRSFSALGKARRRVTGDRRQEWFIWCLGSTLFGCVVSCFGVVFSNQLQILLYAYLASISVAAYEILRVKVPTPEKATIASRPAVLLPSGADLPVNAN